MQLAIPFLGTIGYAPAGETFPTFKRFGRHLADHVVPHPRNNYHPHLLSHRAVALLSLLLITVKVAGIALVTIGPALPADASAITTENILSLTNASRKDNGLATLQLNAKLGSAAQSKANDMLAKQYFAHNTPDGKTPWDFIKATGYSYIIAGENLAVDFIQAENVEDAWMNSPGHRANILNKDFEQIGIGISQGQYQGHNSIFVVQMFGTPPEQPIQTLSAPTQVQQTQLKPSGQVATAPAPRANLIPEVHAASEPQPAPVTLSTPEPVPSNLLINNSIPVSVAVVGNAIEVTVLSNSASKVLARFGERAVMLDPTSSSVWKGGIPLSEAANGGSSVTVEVYDMHGILGASQVASFADSIHNNYNFVPTVADATMHAFGSTFSLQEFENRFYLIFIAVLLVALLIAIAVHRHVQHISLVANGAFVVIFATLLWYYG